MVIPELGEAVGGAIVAISGVSVLVGVATISVGASVAASVGAAVAAGRPPSADTVTWSD